MTGFVPRCVQHTGKECLDCVECLSTIPNGETCWGCASAARCAAFGFTTDLGHRYCSFIPSRFVAVPA